MNNKDTTNEQLMNELERLRRRVAELEESEARHKGTERLLRESEERFQSLHENLPLGYQSLDENGCFIKVNQAWLDMLGYSREEVIGKWFGDFLAPGYQDKFKINFPKFKTAGEIHWVEFEMLRKDGSQISVAFDGQTGRDGRGQFRQTHCILHDISEIKRSQDAVKESEQRYRAVVDKIEVGISLLNSNMEIVEVNKAMNKYFPHVRPACGQICYEQYNDPPRSGPCSYCPCILTLQDGEVHEAITETPAGSEIRYYHLISSPIKDSDGRVQYVIELTEDITDRKRAEEALRLSEERYRRLFEDAPLMYAITRNERGIPLINDCNGLFLSTVGYTRDEVVGRPLADFCSPESRADLLERGGYARALAGEFFIGERQLLTHDGRLIPTFLYTATESDHSGQVIGTRAMFVDVTERKKAEAVVKWAEEFLNTMVENLPIPVLAKSAEDGQFILWNKASETLFGITKEQAIGKTAYDFFPKEQADFFWEKDRYTFASGEIVDIPEEPIRTKHLGTRILHTRTVPVYDKEKRPSYLLAISEDITERKQAEQALRESEQRFRAILENIDLGVSLVDLDHNIIMANTTFGKWFQKPLSEFTGKKCFREFEKRETVCPHCPGVQSIAAGQAAEAETEVIRNDGTPGYLRVRAFPMFGSEGTATGVIEVVEDITERKRAEREKERLSSQLLQSQKMESIGTLAGGIAHDFNNLLTVILGYSELIISEKDEGDPEYEDLAKIIHAGRTAGELVQQILAFGRKTEFKPRPVNLNKQVEQLEKMLARLIPKTIEIEISLDSGLPTVNADPAQIEQVLLNLAVNSRDAMPNGGRLLIETQTVLLDEKYCRFHLEAAQGRHALLVVTDTGVGIDRTTMGRIFEPYYTTKKLGQGTGLGLAMVYGIVKSHGGHITCESELGRGTTFKIYLPAYQAEGEADVKISEEFSELGTGTILLVDDEEFVRLLGQRILEKAGYTVIKATNGHEAVEIYKEKGNQISLVILDLIMPVMDGNQCLEEILRVDPGARVLIASGYSPDGTIGETLTAGAKGFVEKPYNLRQLVKTVRDALNEK